jgi:hypothetical protein
MLLVALSLLTLATWLSSVALADAMFIFAAFSIGGVWSKYSSAGLAKEETQHHMVQPAE